MLAAMARVAPEKALVCALPAAPSHRGRARRAHSPGSLLDVLKYAGHNFPTVSVFPPRGLCVCAGAHVMRWFKFHIGDWAAATAHLSSSEEGLYLRALNYCYSNECPLPADKATLRKVLRVKGGPEIRNLDSVVTEFFNLTQDGWIQKRVSQEVEKYKKNSERWAENGKKGDPNCPPNCPPKLVNQEPRTKNQEEQPLLRLVPTELTLDGPGEPEPPRLPDCPHEKIVNLYHEILPTCPRVVVWTDARQATLRAFWRAWGVKKGWKREADGIAFVERYLRHVAESKFLTGRAPASGDRPPFVADLAWLIKPANFAKVVEGKFHQEQG